MTSNVYVLYHIRPEGDLLIAGFYTSEEQAQAAIERLTSKQGFSAFPDCFEINTYELDTDLFPDGVDPDEEEDEEHHHDAESADESVH